VNLMFVVDRLRPLARQEKKKEERRGMKGGRERLGIFDSPESVKNTGKNKKKRKREKERRGGHW